MQTQQKMSNSNNPMQNKRNKKRKWGIPSFVKSAFNSAVNTVKDIGSGVKKLWNGATNAISSAVGGAVGKAKMAIAKMNDKWDNTNVQKCPDPFILLTMQDL